LSRFCLASLSISGRGKRSFCAQSTTPPPKYHRIGKGWPERLYCTPSGGCVASASIFSVTWKPISELGPSSRSGATLEGVVVHDGSRHKIFLPTLLWPQRLQAH